jgi:small ligand-binding sensory domain FIST
VTVQETDLIRAAAGISTQPDPTRAVLEVVGQILQRMDGCQPDFCIVFSTYEDSVELSAMLATLSEAIGTPYLAGCSAAGVLVQGSEIEQGPAVAVLAVSSDQILATPFIFKDEGDHGMTAGTRAGQRLLGSRDSDDVLLVWPDPFHVRPDRLLQSLDAVLGNVPVIGGAASAQNGSTTTFQFCGTESQTSSVSGIRLGGKFRHITGITQGCRPLGEPMRVTRAHENLILELEGRPPLELLIDRVPSNLLNDPQWALNFLFVGLLPDPASAQSGEYMVRNILSIDPEGGVIAVADRIEDGQQIVFAQRESSSARHDLSELLARIGPVQTGLDYRFGLYFNCLARGSALHGEPGVDAALLRQALPDVPLLGFFCNAEMGPIRGLNHVFTYTGVLMLVAD